MASTTNEEQNSNTRKENDYSSSLADYRNIRSQQMEFLQRASGLNRPSDQQIPSNKAEYFIALRQWLWDYHCWNSFNAGFPFFLMSQMYQCQTANNIFQPIQNQTSISNRRLLPQVGNVQQRLIREPRGGAEYKIPPIWKRFVAELIDFLLLFIVKLVLTFMAADYLHLIDVDKYNFDFLLDQVDYKMALEVTSEIVMLEVVHRSFVCLFEAISLSRGITSIGGTTPGKALLGLRCIFCEFVTDLPASNRVFIFPATDVGFFWALLRSIIKNFSLAFFFPVSFTIFFFSHNRTAYDVISNTIIVENPDVQQP